LVEILLHELCANNDSADVKEGVVAPYDPGALPLLAHALRATWEGHEENMLTIAGYRAIGGIHGAIANTAETTFQGFGPAAQQVARRLLLRMVEIGNGIADTRLRANRDTLIANSPDPAATSTVFDAFVRARLITEDQNTAEFTHDALLRAWPRLRSWIEADRAGLYVHQQLTEAAQRWDRDGRPASTLYRGTAFAVAQDWAQDLDHHADLGRLERDFLTASDELRRRQQEAVQRRAHRTRLVIASLVVLLILSLAGGGIALYQRYSQQSPIAVLRGHTADVKSVAFSPDGRTLASTSTDRTVRLWNVTDPAHSATLGPPMSGHTGDVTSVAFSPDSHTLATASADRTVRLWNVSDPASPTTLAPPLVSDTDPFNSVAFSPDSHTLATASADRTVRLWNVTDPVHPTPIGPPLTGHTSYVNSVAFSPDSHTVATASADRTVRLWNVTDPVHPTPIVPPLTGHTSYVNSVAFSPDSHTVASASADGTVKLWNMTDRVPPTHTGTLTGSTGSANSVSFSPNKHILATGRADGTVQLWNIP
jgi:uncharacterized protein YjiK